MGPGTHLKKRIKLGDPGINRLDKIAKQHDIDYSQAKNLKHQCENESRCENGEGDQRSPRQENLDQSHRQENHATQTRTQIVKDFNG